jgi:hypothetical protein
MLSLFSPWSRSETEPLKSTSTPWYDAWTDFCPTLSSEKEKIIGHMQEQWECKLAADLYSVNRQKRYAGTRADNGFLSSDDISADLANDIAWQLGQIEGCIGEDSERDVDLSQDIDDEGPETLTNAAQVSAEAAVGLGRAAKIYKTPSTVATGVTKFLTDNLGCSTEGGNDAHANAGDASLLLASEKLANRAAKHREFICLYRAIAGQELTLFTIRYCSGCLSLGSTDAPTFGFFYEICELRTPSHHLQEGEGSRSTAPG